jgi:hypothetical protein
LVVMVDLQADSCAGPRTVSGSNNTSQLDQLRFVTAVLQTFDGSVSSSHSRGSARKRSCAHGGEVQRR